MKTAKMKIATIFLLVVMLTFQGCLSDSQTGNSDGSKVLEREYTNSVSVSGRFVFDVESFYRDTTVYTDLSSANNHNADKNSVIRYISHIGKDDNAPQTKEFVFEGQSYSLTYEDTMFYGCTLYDRYVCYDNNCTFSFDINGNLRSFSHIYDDTQTPMSIDDAVIEAKEIAQTYMSVDLDGYELSATEEWGYQKIKFTKYVNGHKTREDYVYFTFESETGELLYCDCGGQFGIFSSDLEIVYDEDAVDDYIIDIMYGDTGTLNKESASFRISHELIWVNEGIIGFYINADGQLKEPTTLIDHNAYKFIILPDGTVVGGRFACD